jgi:Ca-activated chloride channel homolog
MRRRISWLAAAFAAAGSTGAWAAGDAPAANTPTAVLLIDGSGSMWGRLSPDNRAKIDILREKLTGILQTPSSTRVGLVSFGHRRRGDCSDVELIAPADSPRDAVIAPLAKLNPRGPGPLTAGLKAAVDAIGTSRPAEIIAIGDGADNCWQDTCAAAAEIAKNSPGLTIHMIGIGITAAERPRVSCIAEATGGHYYDITDSVGLNAAIDEATKLAMLSPGGAPGAQAGASDPVAPPPPAGASIRVSAALGNGTPLLTVPMYWRIFKAGETAPLAQNQGPDISAKLDAGSYDVEAKLGSLSARQKIEVEAGTPQSIILPLNAAHLRVRASAIKGGEASPTAVLTVASGDTPAAIGREGSADLYLPPADYTVTIADGVARSSQNVSLAAGDDKPLDIALGTGRLELTATTGAQAAPVQDVLYTIFEDDPESPDGRREVAQSRAANAAFTLPAGTYYISARSGAADVRQRIAVGAGEKVQRALALDLAPLKVSTIIAGAPARAEHSVLYRVDRIDGEQTRIARSIGPQLELTLPAGKYRVSATLARYHLSATKDITLEPGKPANAELAIEGAEITFRPASGSASKTGDMYWEVIDATGMPVWRQTGTETTALLAPGHYTVRLDARSGHNSAVFDVRAGENQKIEIGPG